MKLTKEELLTKVNELEIEDDIKISLMEDISDSLEETTVEDVVNEETKRELEDLKFKYEDLKARYKERFLSDNNEEDEREEVIEEEKENVIDVKEI